MRRPLALLLLLATLAACDSPVGPEPLTFQSLELGARGDAALAVSGGALVVSGLSGNRSGGFTVAGQPGRLDVDIDPLAVPAGGRFGIEVEDASGADVASFYVNGTAQGALDFVYDFGATLGVTSVLIHYRLGGEDGAVVFGAEVGGGSNRVAASLVATSGGTGSGSTGSTHVIRENGKYVVVSDADDAARRAGGCSGFLVTPPPPFDQQYRVPVCTDWIEIEPIVTAPMPQGNVSVTARGVGSFTVRQLGASGY